MQSDFITNREHILKHNQLLLKKLLENQIELLEKAETKVTNYSRWYALVYSFWFIGTC